MDTMAGYTKLFNSILASTIWREEKETKILWITMLAMADKDGMVEASVPGLADLARLTVKETQAALAILESPDEFSRTKDHQGRRIEPVLGGWLILNHALYRQKMDMDERREYLRIKKQESRERARLAEEACQQMSTKSTQAESREQRADPEAKRSLRGGKVKLSDPRHREFIEWWTARYNQVFGRDYVISGAKDGANLSKFLKASPNVPLNQICETVEAAWREQFDNRYAKDCKRSTDITGFVTSWNGICSELERKVGNRKSMQVEGGGF